MVVIAHTARDGCVRAGFVGPPKNAIQVDCGGRDSHGAEVGRPPRRTRFEANAVRAIISTALPSAFPRRIFRIDQRSRQFSPFPRVSSGENV